MTLPEHAICSVLLCEFGVRQRFGFRGVSVVTAAGLAPDLDSAVKLVADHYFWELHHALGHGLIPIVILSTIIASAGRLGLGLRPWSQLLAWCILAGCVHAVSDSLYWWGIQVFWPLSSWEIHFDILEYLDLILLSFWMIAAFCLYKWPNHGRSIASWAFGIIACYVLIRAVCPKPTGLWRRIMGGWIYEPPQGTQILDWW